MILSIEKSREPRSHTCTKKCVSDETTGFVLDPHDEKAWAQSLLDITKNPNQASAIGQNGYRD